MWIFWSGGILCFSSSQLLAQGSCSCTNCPQAMPDLFTGNFYIQVQDAANPTLGQNGQGVCGVVLHFDHEYVGDLRITLSSPAGQSITLVDPTGLFGETDGTNWHVTFTRCSETADPDPGFTAIWNNDQNWGIFGNYKGTYYPFSGCLEDFNTGPVNGQWTLTVNDVLDEDVGNFYDYQILFCDPAGIECFSCVANAGNLLQADISACKGDSTLKLQLPPTYTPQQPAPPTGVYAYTYIISKNGVIAGYDSIPDLRKYPAGMYTVCGLSFRASEKKKIPPPDDTLTVTELATRLSSAAPPFCGKITSNCVNVNILPTPPDIETFDTVCAPACVDYYGQTFCDSGTHAVVLLDKACPYKAILHLTVLQPVSNSLDETVCSGTCAATPGFQDLCQPGTYTRTFTGASGCDSVVTLHLTLLSPTAAILDPPPFICGQTNLTLQSNGSTPPGAGVSYMWSAANGGTLSGPVNATTANATTAGTYQLTVCQGAGNTTCCDTAVVTVQSDQHVPATPAAIAGPDQLCLGQSIALSIDPVPWADSYLWTVPNGVAIMSGQGSTAVELEWNSGQNGSVCVRAVNDCGVSAPACLNIYVSSPPAAPTLSGPAVVCAGNTSNYEIPTIPGAVEYLWQVAGGVLLSQNDTTAQVQWPQAAQNASICVLARNTCGESPPNCLSIALDTLPALYAGIDSSVCGPLAPLNALPATPPPSGYWTLLGGPGMATIQDTAAAYTSVQTTLPGAYLFQWNVHNGACTAFDTVKVQFNPLPATGQVEYQCLNTNAAYTVSFTISGGNPPYTVNGAGLPAGVFASAPIQNDSLYLFMVADANGCTAPLLSGTHNCQCTTAAGHMSDQVLLVCDNQPAVAQYLGGHILGAADTAVFVLHTLAGTQLGKVVAINSTGVFGFQPGMFYDSVYYIAHIVAGIMQGQPDFNNPCTVVAPGQPVVFYPQTQAFAGQDTVVCGYTYPLQGAFSPGQWTYSAGTSAGTLVFEDPEKPNSRITASAPGQYTLIWSVSNPACSASDSVEIEFQACGCLSFAGTMPQTALRVCETDSVEIISNGDYSTDGNDTTAYVLHTGSGSSLGQVWAQNNTGRFGFLPGMSYNTLYYGSLIVGNKLNGAPDPADPCLAVAPGQPVMFLEMPKPDAGADAAFCGTSGILNASPGIFSGAWAQTAGPAAALLNDPSTANTAVSVSVPGNYTFQWTESNDLCTQSDTVTLLFREVPALNALAENCNGTNDAYSVSFSITGGMPPYVIDGLPGALNGSSFVSQNLSSGAPYQFTIRDANGCAAAPVSGGKNCQCSTYAGTMAGAALRFCAGQPATAPWDSNPVTDGNDLVRFILHDQPGTKAGSIFAQSDQPVFPFSSNLKTGTTYYISAIAGNNANGNVDLSDPCLSVAPGTPVQWRALPTAFLNGDTTICAGSEARLIFNGTGVFPLDLYWQDNTGLTFTTSVPDNQVQDQTLVLQDTTLFILTGVTDSGSPACTAALSDTAMVAVVQPPHAGIALPPKVLCAGGKDTVLLSALLTGADTGGQWSEISNQPSTGNAFNPAKGSFAPEMQAPGAYVFQYRLAGPGPCSPVEAEVQVDVLPAPLADAGPDLTLDCVQPEVQLGGMGSSGGSGVTFLWQDSTGISLGNESHLWVDTSGVYRLVVSDPAGCTASDTTFVTAKAFFEVSKITITPIRCHGEHNGKISVETVANETPPLLFSLNGNAWTTQRQFTGLGPGAYIIQAQDGAGCTWQSDTLWLTDPPVIKIELGTDIEAALGDSVYLYCGITGLPGTLDSIIWIPLVDTAARGQPYQKWVPVRSMTVKATAVDKNGCPSSDDVRVWVRRERHVYFPNAFSPGFPPNDVFSVYGGKDVEQVDVLRVFNRWGECVFEASGFQANGNSKGWSGTFRNQSLPAGVYSYFARVRFIDGDIELYRGDVTLIR